MARKKARTPRPEPRPKPPAPRARWLAVAAGIAAVAILLNLPTLHFQFVSWDDSHYVTENPWIRGFTAANLIHIFTRPWFVSYMPLQLVSYVLDYSLWGFRPEGYHLQQVVLHALDSVLAFELVRRLFGRFWLAAIAGLLFAVHPSHVESVAWISARKDVLSALFLIPSVIFYLEARGERSPRRNPYWISVLLFALAVLSKVNVVVALLFLVLLDLVSKRGWMTIAIRMIPYLAVGLSVSIVNWIVEVKTTATYAKDPILYFVLKGRTAWDYLAHLTGIPRLNPIYDTPPLSADAVSMLVALAGLLFLPALAWLGFRRKNRALGLGAGWIFVMLLPAVFFPVPTYLADRYLYLASLGFCWLVAYALVEGASRVRPRTLSTGIAVVVTIALTAFFWTRTDRYNRVWANSETLWSYTIQASQDFRAYNNLARVRMEQKRWGEAERLFRLGSRQPNVTSWDGLTAVYYSTGQYAKALEANDEALRLHRRKASDPVEEADLHYKRGATLLALRRLDEGIAELTEAVRINPRHPDAARMLGLAQQAKREGG